MELFTNFEIIIMVSVVGFLVFVILLLSLLELISRRKEKRNLVEKENLEANTEVEEEAKVEIEPIKSVKEDNVDEPLLQKKENLETQTEVFSSNVDIQKVQQELPQEEKENLVQIEEFHPEVQFQEPEILIEDLDAPIMPAIEVLEEDTSMNANLELLKVEEELKNPMSLEDTISSLEAIEEESAIISYQELLDVTKEMQILPQEDMGDEPISITEVYEKFTGESLEHPSVDDIYQASLTNNIETENLNEIQLENTANLEKLDKEIRKTNKVLNMLNELKKNLD